MAILGDANTAEAAVKQQEKAIGVKRKVIGDPKWKPTEGAGMIPEEEWKQYSPESKDVADYVQDGNEKEEEDDV